MFLNFIQGGWIKSLRKGMAISGYIRNLKKLVSLPGFLGCSHQKTHCSNEPGKFPTIASCQAKNMLSGTCSAVMHKITKQIRFLDSKLSKHTFLKWFCWFKLTVETILFDLSWNQCSLCNNLSLIVTCYLYTDIINLSFLVKPLVVSF